MNEVILSVGSNQGDPLQNIGHALVLLAQRGVSIVRSSPIYQTKPWGQVAQDDFFNLCLEINTELTPFGLLHLLHQIEDRLGRVREVHWGPRTIDLDIILWKGTWLRDPSLTIPHPRWRERAFVLAPLLALYPDGVVWGYDFKEAALSLHDQIEVVLQNKIKDT